MLRAALALVLPLALPAAAAWADVILYATAATTGEVTSYCVGPEGGLTADPKQRINTNGRFPGRVIAQQLPGGQFLYVGETDRVEVFRIGDGGQLSRIGRIPARPLPDQPDAGLENMDPRDLAIQQAPDGTWVLYVPQRAYDRLAAFPLDPGTGLSTVATGVCTTGRECQSIADCQAGESCEGGRCVPGSPPACTSAAECGSGTICRDGVCLPTCDPGATDPNAACAGAGGVCTPSSDQKGTSCVLGPLNALWQDVKVANQLVYTSRNVDNGSVLVYQVGSDGNFANGTLVVNEEVDPKINPTQCVVETTDPEQKHPNACDQVNASYPVPSADCPMTLELKDMNGMGQPIIDTSGQPLTIRAQTEYSRRGRLNGAGPLILTGSRLYVSERFRRTISGFDLCPTFQPREPSRKCQQNPDTKGCPCVPAAEDIPPGGLCPPGGFYVDPTLGARNKDTGQRVCTLRFRQPRLAKKGGRTSTDIPYGAMALANGKDTATILGSQFGDGRIDAYQLRDNGLLPREPTARTSRNVATSPVRQFVYRPPGVSLDQSAGVLYVGAGEIDRVEAYRLYPNGLPRDRRPFSVTTRLTNTFPNDVTIVELSGPCS